MKISRRSGRSIMHQGLLGVVYAMPNPFLSNKKCSIQGVVNVIMMSADQYGSADHHSESMW